MTKSAFDKIMAGLNDAKAFLDGREVGAEVHRLRLLGSEDIRSIRARTGLSQAAFARHIGVAKGTYLQWEQGRRSPAGPALVLLNLLERNPHVVSETLGQNAA